MKAYGKNLFQGTAEYYTQYRPVYPAELIRFLVNRLSLDGTGKMLDIGCGTGQLTLRFTDWFEEIFGIDPEPEMIMEAIRFSETMRVENVEWVNGNFDMYKAQTAQSFELVTIAKAFHWMDREEVLETLYKIVSVGGAVAIIDNYHPNKEVTLWQQRVNEVVERWYGKERRAGDSTYTHPKERHQEIIARSKFDLEIHQLPSYKYKWTIPSIIGNIYSTSYGSPRFLADNQVLFEEDLKKTLLDFNETGKFEEEIVLTVNLAVK